MNESGRSGNTPTFPDWGFSKRRRGTHTQHLLKRASGVKRFLSCGLECGATAPTTKLVSIDEALEKLRWTAVPRSVSRTSLEDTHTINTLTSWSTVNTESTFATYGTASTGGDSHTSSVKLDDDGNVIPDFYLQGLRSKTSLENRRIRVGKKKRRKKTKTRKKVRFEYPPVSKLKVIPRKPSHKLTDLFYTSHELDQIEDDERATRNAPDVECVAVSYGQDIDSLFGDLDLTDSDGYSTSSSEDGQERERGSLFEDSDLDNHSISSSEGSHDEGKELCRYHPSSLDLPRTTKSKYAPKSNDSKCHGSNDMIHRRVSVKEVHIFAKNRE